MRSIGNVLNNELICLKRTVKQLEKIVISYKKLISLMDYDIKEVEIMSDKYDIFDFRIGRRPSGKKVIEIHINLPDHYEPNEGRTYQLGFLTKENIDKINKLYGEL